MASAAGGTVLMLSRSRTADFQRYRDYAVKRRPPKQRPTSSFREDDEAPLVNGGDIEMGNPSQWKSAMPPDWAKEVSDIHEIMTNIKTQMRELTELHNKHVNQVGFDGDRDEEQTIEILTAEITGLFQQGQRKIVAIGKKSKLSNPSQQQQRVIKNVMQSLATRLQEQSEHFRKAQSHYLQRMKSREERVKGFQVNMNFEEDTRDEEEIVDPGFTSKQQQYLKENTLAIREREKEITNIVNSISELSQIFKDLAILIVNQGTILDRIDYNIEMAAYHIDEGRKHLEDSEKYQKKATKKYIIILLILAIIAFIFVIIFAKKHKS